MHSLARRLFSATVVFASFASIAQAHPGHDDGHELTWELRHLLAHSGATLSWMILLGVALAVGVWFVRRSGRSGRQWFQSLRGSQPSRGQ